MLTEEGVTAMREAPSSRTAAPSRRTVLTAAAALATASLAGCTDDETPAPPDPDLVLRNRVADQVGELVRAYAAATAAFPGLRSRLSPLAAEHEAHVAALRGPAGSARLPSPTGSVSSAPPPAPQVPATATATVRWLADLEHRAARRRRRSCLRAGPDLARLLGSVAACEAAHASLLRSGA
jgi:hypothetical protein